MHGRTALQAGVGLPAGEVAAHLVDCLARAHHVREPFDYWLLDDALPVWAVDAIAALPFSAPTDVVFSGRRETNNSSRVYFTPENRKRFAVCEAVAGGFGDPAVVAAIERTTGTDLSQGLLRVEYCQDIDGFWLEPHLDISVKLFTMLVYLSGEPELYDAGTDIYDASAEHRCVATAPYAKNKGLIFIPGFNTWHGLSKRPIRGVRKSLIINWVSPDWRDRWELAC